MRVWAMIRDIFSQAVPPDPPSLPPTPPVRPAPSAADLRWERLQTEKRLREAEALGIDVDLKGPWT